MKIISLFFAFYLPTQLLLVKAMSLSIKALSGVLRARVITVSSTQGQGYHCREYSGLGLSLSAVLRARVIAVGNTQG